MQVVSIERVNKNAYHLQPSINCGYPHKCIKTSNEKKLINIRMEIRGAKSKRNERAQKT
jgi:hypothetical protein